MEKTKSLYLYFTSYIKVNLRWIINLHVNTKTINGKENKREYLCDLGISKTFLESIQKAQTIKEKY